MWSSGGSISRWKCCVDAWNALQGFLQVTKYWSNATWQDLWNPSDFGYQITRRRNFFRNFDDVENIPSPTLVFGDHFGPLLRQNGEMIPLAPLLRTRDTLPNGIMRASWTLYQPHALVWNYAFWNGKANFAKKMAVGTKNIPQCQWESIIPPPFLEQWKAFLELLSSHNFQGSDVDAIVLPLVPMFHTEAYNLPFRILKEQEVIQLSGLQDFFFPALPDKCETWSVNNWNKNVIEIKFPQKKQKTNNKPTQKQQNKQHPHTSQGTGQANLSGKFAN